MKNAFRLLNLGALLLGTLALAEDKMEMKTEPMSAYPIDYCLVSGEKLGSMGEPVKYLHEGREIRFCCDNCIADFQKEPEKYTAQLDKAIIDTQGKDYPLTTCVVSGEEFGSMGKPVDIVYNNELVRFCCSGCKKDFNKDPDKYMKMLHDARHAQMMNGGAMEKMPESQEKSGHDEHQHDGHGH